MFGRPFDHISGSFAGVTTPAKELQIARVIRSAAGYRYNMVNLKLWLLFLAASANAILLPLKHLEIIERIKSAILGKLPSTVLLVDYCASSDVLNVRGLPSIHRSFSFCWILLRPALYFGSMGYRISRTSSSRSSRHVSGVATIPFLTSRDGTLDAVSICNKAFILMPMDARLALRVVSVTARSSRDALGILRRFGLMLENVYDGAHGADARAGVSLGKMTVLARLARGIETLVVRFRDLSFWDFLHLSPGANASYIFIAVKAA